MATTVKVPGALLDVFERAEDLVGAYFRCKRETPESGHIDIEGERYILVRAASMSVEFYDLMVDLYMGREPEAQAVARNLLFHVAHFIGRSDARAFHAKLGLEDPVERLSAGPVHFAHSGWAFVDISEECLLEPDERFRLVYDHPYSFESNSWRKAGREAPFPVCFMNAGYSAGWCEESFGLPLVATEILCSAHGDDCCRFVMAPPGQIEAAVEGYLREHPDIAAEVTTYEVPGEFARKELEERLRVSEDRYRLLFENALDAILIIENGVIAQANGAATVMFGRSRTELQGQPCTALAPAVQPGGDDSATLLDGHLDRALAGGVVEFPWRCIGAGDRALDTQVFLHHVEGMPGTLLGIFRDVTAKLRAQAERERLEGEVRQLQKMEALGTLAGGVAHDFNNLLGGILGAVEVMREELPRASPAHGIAEDAISAIGRAGALVRQLLAFASRSPNLEQRVDLNQLVEKHHRLLRETVDRRVQLEACLDPDPCVVVGDSNHLAQVVVNLALNAKDAVLQRLDGLDDRPLTGRITLATRAVRGPGGVEQVELVVEDDGCGMDAATCERATEPFFTTKGVGQGTGLGLTMVYGIVQRHSGQLEIESEPGRGTRMTVVLPRAAAAPAPEAPAQPAARAPAGRGTILCIDDEPLLRRLVQRHLEPLGFQVLLAADGEEGLELVCQDPTRLDLVILDLMMPGLSGQATLEQLRGLAPELPVLIVSGYSMESDAGELLARGASAFLTKPYRASELIQQVHGLLGTSSS
jgi:PAS domain S-box-containing protein